jgi:hypothetical protein
MLVLVEPGGSRFRVTGAVRAVLLWACSAPDAVRLEAMVRGRTDLSAQEMNRIDHNENPLRFPYVSMVWRSHYLPPRPHLFTRRRARACVCPQRRLERVGGRPWLVEILSAEPVRIP